MRVFQAGIMQGSHRGAILHAQDYRGHLKQLVLRHLPQSEVYDPLADHSDSVNYDEETGRSVFYRHNRMCGEVDVVLAFVPEASMGTAIEMWEAYRNGRAVIAISPLEHNWSVKYCSHAVYPDVRSFEAALTSGQIHQEICRVLGAADRPGTDSRRVVS